MSARNLTLFIPGLFGPGPTRQQSGWPALVSDQLMIQALESVLSRAQRQSAPASSLTQLFQFFGLSATERDLPVAAITRSVDVGPSSGFWLRADPVHVKPDRDRIVMFGNQRLHITRDESAQIVAEFNSLFAEDGITMEALTPTRWYLKLDAAPDITTTPLPDVIGEDVHPCLPAGKDAMSWHRFLNEVQMLLHGSRVNEQRRQSGEPEINSIWLWGGGELPDIAKKTWSKVWSNEIISRGLAQISDTPQSALPASGEEWLEQVEAGGQHLVIIDALAEPVALSDIASWCSLVQSVNDEWFVVLRGAIKSGALNNLTLVSEGVKFSINTKSLQRWWRRHKRLHHFA